MLGRVAARIQRHHAVLQHGDLLLDLGAEHVEQFRVDLDRGGGRRFRGRRAPRRRRWSRRFDRRALGFITANGLQLGDKRGVGSWDILHWRSAASSLQLDDQGADPRASSR